MKSCPRRHAPMLSSSSAVWPAQPTRRLATRSIWPKALSGSHMGRYFILRAGRRWLSPAVAGHPGFAPRRMPASLKRCLRCRSSWACPKRR